MKNFFIIILSRLEIGDFKLLRLGSEFCKAIMDRFGGDVSMSFHKKPDGHISVNVEFGEEEGQVSLKNIEKRIRACS